jgi:putative phosphoribosyl transferase
MLPGGRNYLYPPRVTPLFNNRQDAGRQLALKLSEYKERPAVVLGIPNGGMHLAVEIALAIGAVLDVVVVRKLPLPLSPESGFGAVADDGSLILNEDIIKREGVTRAQIDEQVASVTVQVRQRSLLYRKDRPLSMMRGKTAIIVDDGLASGYTMLAAVESVRRRRANEIIVAVPVASSIAMAKVQQSARVVTLAEGSASRFTVADYYRHWHDVPDSDVLKMLDIEQTRSR